MQSVETVCTSLVQYGIEFIFEKFRSQGCYFMQHVDGSCQLFVTENNEKNILKRILFAKGMISYDKTGEQRIYTKQETWHLSVWY